ncbi:uncharacterized protein LOC118437345 [Folsomia candida]|uniref:uncharacterized protein LOC118437345 n=1 Tax=Folsomia candida TaxID=158441 RepID=UPI001605071E|nr:uncharacterized protein LOC118437345 [Folsomia candida]
MASLNGNVPPPPPTPPRRPHSPRVAISPGNESELDTLIEVLDTSRTEKQKCEQQVLTSQAWIAIGHQIIKESEENIVMRKMDIKKWDTIRNSFKDRIDVIQSHSGQNSRKLRRISVIESSQEAVPLSGNEMPWSRPQVVSSHTLQISVWLQELSLMEEIAANIIPEIVSSMDQITAGTTASQPKS